MRDYGKVSPKFWTGGTGKSLRGNAEVQLLALYLMTSPHSTMIGVYHCPVLYMAHETGLTFEGASKALQSLIEAQFCAYDEDSETVWVCEMAAHQIGEPLSAKDKQAIGIARQYEQIPQGQIRRGFYARYGESYHLPNDQKTPSPLEAPSKPLRSQEQEQEQEKNNNTFVGTAVAVPDPDVAETDEAEDESADGKAIPPCPYDAVRQAYNEALPMLPQSRELSPKRQRHLQARWRDRWRVGKYASQADGVAYWRRFFDYVAASDFLNGSNADWRPDFGWLIEPENFLKVLEGKYHDNREHAA